MFHCMWRFYVMKQEIFPQNIWVLASVTVQIFKRIANLV